MDPRSARRARAATSVLAALLTLLGAGSARADLNAGLVAYWSFDDGTAADNSGNGHDGTVHGATPCPGVSGQGFCFDGIDDFIEILRTSDLRFRNQSVTFAAWATFPDNIDAYRSLVYLGDTPDYYPHVWLCKSRSGYLQGRAFMQLGDADVHVCFSASLADGHGLGDGRWLCLAGVADWAKGTITLYIDGWPQTSGPVCDYDIGLAEHLALYLGRAAHAGDFHHGNLDEVRIYDRALSFEEVRELCAAVPVPVLPGSWGRVKGMHRR